MYAVIVRYNDAPLLDRETEEPLFDNEGNERIRTGGLRVMDNWMQTAAKTNEVAEAYRASGEYAEVYTANLSQAVAAPAIAKAA